MEEFKNCLPKEMKIHLEDQGVGTMNIAAKLADGYFLSHKISNKGKTFDTDATQKKNSAEKTQKSPKSSPKKEVTCFSCHGKGHVRSECPSFRKKNDGKKPVTLIRKVCSNNEPRFSELLRKEHIVPGMEGYGKYFS